MTQHPATAPILAPAAQEPLTAEPLRTSVTATAISSAAPSPDLLESRTSSPLPTPLEPLQPTATNPVQATPLPSQTLSPAPSPTITAVPIIVNGVSQDEIIILSEETRQNVREIYAFGQALGRNPRAFSKLGDSVTLTDHFLTRFDSGHYDLGPYEYLQPTIDHFTGSFARYGVATKVGLHAWSIFDPLWANKDWCLPDEHMVACEIRLFNPSILLVKIGSNDNGAAAAFDGNVRQLIEYAIGQGVIPILGTKADRFEGPDDRNNKMLRQIAADYGIPLWDYDRLADTLPRRGLSGDDVHMTMADANDYTDPQTFERGYPMSDLTALMLLHAILQEENTSVDP